MLDSKLLLHQITSALREHPHLRRAAIEVVAAEDGVLLNGTVNSFFVKQMAQEAIRELDPDIRIDNRLKVQAAVPSPLGLTVSTSTPAQSESTSTY